MNDGDIAVSESLTDSLWLPIWTDESTYDYLRGAPSLQFAWEFLRRNDEYKREFTKWIVEWLRWWTQSPRLEKPKSVTQSACVICDYFGLSPEFGLRDPGSISPPVFQAMAQMGRQIISCWNDGVKTDFPHPRHPPSFGMDVRIVSDVDLEQQLDFIRLAFNEFTRANGNEPRGANRTHFLGDKYIDYLRVYDAVAWGGDMQLAASTLAPNNQGVYERIKKQFKRAEELVYGGYLDLVRPAFPDSSGK